MTDPRPDASGSLTYVLIAARAYSGSTLLAGLLGAHPEIATVSEVSGRRREMRMDAFRCSCGRLMIECPFWLSVERGMHERGYADFRLSNFELNFSPGTGWVERARTGSLRWSLAESVRDRLVGLLPGNRAAFDELGRRNRSFAQTVLALTGRRVFVDASKERMRARYLHRYLGPDLKVIHLVRDVRGVVDSVGRHAGQSIDVGATARDWARTNLTLARHIAQLPAQRRALVRYEDLCTAPADTLAALFEFCGVEPRRSATEADRHEQHLIGNDRRLETDWAKIELDERWRSRLSAGDLARIAAEAGEFARRHYPDATLEATSSSLATGAKGQGGNASG